MDICDKIAAVAKSHGASHVHAIPFKDKNALVMVFQANPGLDLSELDSITERIAKDIRRKGFFARALSTKDWEGVSLRALAESAGIGFIGKSGLLITEIHGPRVRLSCIVTDANVLNGQFKRVENSCEGCSACVVSCPVGALAKRDAELCKEFTQRMEKARCTICIDVCPYSR